MPRKPPKISDGLRAKFKAVAHEVGELVPTAAYANYVIIDPTFSDHNEIFPGVPIYIGQTARIVPRIQEHLRHALAPAAASNALYRRMGQLIRIGALPIFRILEVHRTRADSIRAEAVWAQRLLRSGADLLNFLPEQSRILTASSVGRMQRVRLLTMSLPEAYAAGLVLQIACRRGCFARTISPVDLIPWFGDRITLMGIRTKARQCPVCGGINRYAVADEADSPAPDGFENVPEFPGELPSAEFEFRLFDGQNRSHGYD